MKVWASHWAWLFLIPLGLMAFYYLTSSKNKIATLQFSSMKNLSGLAPSWRAQFFNFPGFIKIVALFVAILALARPQSANEKIRRDVEGVDIMIALDISDSMLIEDMQPINRMESSKKKILDFIKQRVSDRIGIVVFSGESYSRVPLTLDYKILRESVEQIKPSRNIKMGTAIGVALANAVARLKDSTAKTRIVILMTDGENNSGTIDPLTAMQIAKGFGIRVYTIGMGKDGDAQLPIITKGPDGREQKRYQPIHSTVNDKLLTQLAEETGGKYFRAITTKALEGVFGEINKLEKTKIEVSRYTKYAELFPGYLWWAILLYLFAMTMGFTVFRRSV
ncbi:MAG: VWA domain-containing protein [Pseudomonadota bacterium]|nr:VWA domain-containing protein [Pseudomonadota bacterium]